MAGGLFEREQRLGVVAGARAVLDRLVDVAGSRRLVVVEGELRQASAGLGDRFERLADAAMQARPAGRWRARGRASRGSARARTRSARTCSAPRRRGAPRWPPRSPPAPSRPTGRPPARARRARTSGRRPTRARARGWRRARVAAAARPTTSRTPSGRPNSSMPSTVPAAACAGWSDSVAGLGEVAQHLAEEERVALGRVEQRAGERGRDVTAGEHRHQALDVVARQAADDDALEELVAPQIGAASRRAGACASARRRGRCRARAARPPPPSGAGDARAAASACRPTAGRRARARPAGRARCPVTRTVTASNRR